MGIYDNWDKYNPVRSMDLGVSKGVITQKDREIIASYLRDQTAAKRLSLNRQKKIASHLVNFRKLLDCEYAGVDIGKILDAKIKLDNSSYKQNTRGDYIRILKPFLRWMNEEGYISIPEKKIASIRAEAVDTDTKEPDEILTREEVLKMIEYAGKRDTGIRDQALISMLYESGARIGELARLRWRDMAFDKYGIKLYIDDKKTKKRRYSRLIISAPYLGTWRNKYPGDAEGNSLVFVGLTHQKAGKPLQYYGFVRILQRSAADAGITKRIHPHLFRNSRITHMVAEGYQESVIKESMWNNLGTRQFKTYVKLGEANIDDEFLSKHGIKVKDSESKRIKPRTCGNCQAVNAPTAEYCQKCGFALTDEAKSMVSDGRDISDRALTELLEHPEANIDKLKRLKAIFDTL